MSEIQKIKVGDVIVDRFEITSVMVDNELGVLALVNERATGKGLLVLQLSFAVDSFIEGEIREIFAEMQNISHKSLATLEEFLVSDEVGYIVMGNIDGELLESHLAARREQGQILGLKAAYSFIAHISLGVDTLNQNGKFYGRLSSKEIFITPEGRVRIIHGICQHLARKYLTDAQRHDYFGSTSCAPEIRDDIEQISVRSDIYALALLFAELLSTSPLSEFTGSPEAFIAKLPNVSTTVKECLFQASKIDVEDRFKSVQEFKDSLKRAMDAPNDSDLSSIVVGINDLRSLTGKQLQSMIDVPVVKKPDLFESGSISRPISRIINPEVWIYQKDGMDFGPFDHKALLQKFYDDVINESTAIYNIATKQRQNMGSIPEFEDEIREYLPIRDHNRAQRLAAQKKKDFQKKAGIGGVVVAITVAIAAILVVPIVILYLKPKPVQLNMNDAFPAFEKRFELPKTEEFSLNMDDAKSKALFDPKASEAEIAAAMAEWEARHREIYGNKRKLRGNRPGGGSGGFGDEMDIIVFTGDDGEELETLEDWEVEEQCSNPRLIQKQAECFRKYAGGRRMEVKIKFVIQQTGTIRNVSTTASGDLNDCLISSMSSLKFRQFGGTVKRVTWPVGYY